MIEPPIEILKSVWIRRDDGRWAVDALKGLKLKPKAGCEPRYFEIDSDLELLLQNPTGRTLGEALNYIGPTETILKQSILPVVAWTEGDKAVRTIGTASIVSCTGYALTAAHVLLAPLEEHYGAEKDGDGIKYNEALNFGVLLAKNPVFGQRGFTFYPFEKFWIWGEWKYSPLFHMPPQFVLNTDVAICKIPALAAGRAHQPLGMSLNPFSQAEEAYSIGYAEMIPSIPIEHRGSQISIGVASIPLRVSIGKVTGLFPQNHLNGDRSSTPGPCFEVNAKIPGKMSGAPVFGGGGIVIRGVVSRSFGSEGPAFGSMLGPAMDLPLAEPGISERTLRSLMHEGSEGIAQISGAGL